MEFCRQLGIVEKVRHSGFPRDWPLDSVFVTDLQGYESFLSIVDGTDLWRLQLVDLDENWLQNADIPALMRGCVGGDVAYTIEHGLWETKRTVADRGMDARCSSPATPHTRIRRTALSA